MKIEVVGNVVVLQMDHSIEQLKRLEKRRPEALCVMDDEGKCSKFRVSTMGTPGLNNNGLTVTENGVNGKAAYTFPVDATAGDVKKWIVEKAGTALCYLNTISNQIDAAIAVTTRLDKELMDLIHVHGDDDAAAYSVNVQNEQ